MKKLISILCAAACASFVGCKSIPTTEHMRDISYAVGAAAGLIANETKIDDESRDVVVEIVNIVAQCTPETNQTFEAAWTPIAQAHVEKMIDEGRINETQGDLIMTAFSLVVKGLDYIFEERYPKAKTYKELVSAAVDGFSDGFLTVFKPSNPTVKSIDSLRGYDKDAYEYLIEHL